MEELLLRDGEKIQIAIFFMLFFVGWNLENFISSGLDYKKWKHAIYFYQPACRTYSECTVC